MTPSDAEPALSVSGQIMRNVFESCVMSIYDLSSEEIVAVAAVTADDLVKAISEQHDVAVTARANLERLRSSCDTALHQLDQVLSAPAIP